MLLCIINELAISYKLMEMRANEKRERGKDGERDEGYVEREMNNSSDGCRNTHTNGCSITYRGHTERVD